MADTSNIDALLEMRAKIGREREPRLFDLPGFGNKLQAKYRVLSRQERKDAQKQVWKMAQAGEERFAERGFCLTLARACVGLYTEDEPLNDAWEDFGEEPVIWGNEQFARKLGMDTPNPRAREVIEYVFNRDDDALEEHHNEVSRWMEQSWESDDADF